MGKVNLKVRDRANDQVSGNSVSQSVDYEEEWTYDEPNSSTNPVKRSYTYELPVTGGNAVDLNIHKPTVDLGRGAGLDVSGQSIDLSEATAIIIENKTQGDLVIEQGSANPMTSVLNATGTLTVKPNGAMSLMAERGNGYECSAAAATLQITPAQSGSVVVTVIGYN